MFLNHVDWLWRIMPTALFLGGAVPIYLRAIRGKIPAGPSNGFPEEISRREQPGLFLRWMDVTLAHLCGAYLRSSCLKTSYPAEATHMVEWLQFTLRAWDRRGTPVADTDFLDRLMFDPADTARAEHRPRITCVCLLSLSMDEFADVDTSEDAGAQSQAFAGALHDRLVSAATWLARQPATVFKDLRSTGCVTDIFVGGWITQDQFDLELPPEFLQACGALGLTLSICTND